MSNLYSVPTADNLTRSREGVTDSHHHSRAGPVLLPRPACPVAPGDEQNSPHVTVQTELCNRSGDGNAVQVIHQQTMQHKY